MNLYLWIGIGLAALAGAVLIVPAAWFLRTVQRRENTPAYLKRIPRVRYAPGMEKIIKDGYRVSGSIEGMLLVAAAYSGRRARKRLYAASSYLKESRYKDYETARYTYASDGTEECRKVMEEIIEMELRKRRGLPQKQMTGKPPAVFMPCDREKERNYEKNKL